MLILVCLLEQVQICILTFKNQIVFAILSVFSFSLTSEHHEALYTHTHSHVSCISCLHGVFYALEWSLSVFYDFSLSFPKILTWHILCMLHIWYLFILCSNQQALSVTAMPYMLYYRFSRDGNCITPAPPLRKITENKTFTITLRKFVFRKLNYRVTNHGIAVCNF